MELNQLTIKQAHEGLKKRKFSSVELTKACLARIKNLNPKLNAFITVCESEALALAKKADKQWNNRTIKQSNNYLLGIPFSLKDIFCTEDIRTTAGSKVLENFIPVYDATVVARLKKAGAVILGKTNMDAWAHGSSTETSDWGPTKNPWNLKYLPGGSSGGSAASVIAEMCLASMGTETAGSIRQPSSWCGIVGLKPTYGCLSRYGVIAMGSSLDCPGPMTKTVEDAEIILNILKGKDNLDATTLGFRRTRSANWRTWSLKSMTKIKIGIPKEYFNLQGMDRKVRKTVWEGMKVLEKLGAKLKEVSLVDPKYSIAVYTILQRAEVSSNLARYDGIRYGYGRYKFGNEAKRRIMFGAYVLSAGFHDKYYLKAQKVRSLIYQDFHKVFQKVDILLAPTSPSTALPLGATENQSMFGELQDVLVEASTLAGLPGLNVPCGFVNNLPVGMQIIGPQWSEELLLKVGKLYQQKTDWHKRKPIFSRVRSPWRPDPAKLKKR